MHKSLQTATKKFTLNFVRKVNVEFHEIMISTAGVTGVLLATTDGFEITSIYKDKSIESGRFSAVSSSILALVEAFLSEVGLIGCQSIIFDADNGKAFIASIPVTEFPMVMVVLTSNDIMLGNVLYEIQKMNEKVLQYYRLDREGLS